MGPCMMTGVGVHNQYITSLQIILPVGMPRPNPSCFQKHFLQALHLINSSIGSTLEPDSFSVFYAFSASVDLHQGR